MTRRLRAGLLTLGALSYPFVGLLDQGGTWCGMPPVLLHVFGVWALGIAWAARG